MTIGDAAQKGSGRLRLPEWGEGVYLELHLVSGGLLGPWAKLFDAATPEGLTLPVYKLREVDRWEQVAAQDPPQ